MLKRMKTSTKQKLRSQMSSPKSQKSGGKDGKGGSSVKSKDSALGDDDKSGFTVGAGSDKDNTQELEDKVLKDMKIVEASEYGDFANKTITEEEDGAADNDGYSDDVMKFLKEVDNGKCSPGGTSPENKTVRMSNDPVMAFNDVRISGPARKIKMSKTYERNNVPQNAPMRNKLVMEGIKDKVTRGEEKNINSNAQNDWILN